MRPSFVWDRCSAAALILTLVSFVTGQSCYYPNGNLASDDLPCSPLGDGPCCPLNWQCLSNGLCYLANANYYERHTCTDQTWQSSACPNVCTYNDTAGGNEAVLQCAGEQYCCDGNRSSNCCTAAAALTFALASGSVVTTIAAQPATSSRSSTTPATSSTQASSTQTSSTPASSTQASSTTVAAPLAASASSTVSSSTLTPAVIVSIKTVISSGTQGPQTVYITSTPSAVPSPNTHSDLATVLGCAIGIPIGLAALSLTVFLFWRRRRKQHRVLTPEPDTKTTDTPQHPPSAVLQLGARVSEIYGTPLQAAGAVKGKSELDASPVTSEMSSAPAYSPGMQSGLGLWGQVGGGYRPYRVVHELPG